jgi:hypothetical protein
MAFALALAPPAAAQEDKATHKIEIKGLGRGTFKQGNTTKYWRHLSPHDVVYGREGRPWQPTPTLNFVVYNGQEPYKKVQRIVTKEQ